MSINTPKKIFVDPKDEITFILEKIIESLEDKIIMVIPQNSLIFSSVVSLDILYRVATLHDNLLILVTEDEYGIKIAQKSGYVVVNKVSQISSELWTITKNRQQALINTIKERKEVLRKDMQVPVEEDISEIEDKLDINLEDNLVLEGEILTKEEIKKEDLKKIYRKPLVEPKIVEIDGVQVFAGGDIESFINSKDDDKIVEVLEDENIVNLDNNSKGMNTISNFAGKDFTKVVSKKKTGLLAKLGLRRSKSDENRNVNNNLGLEVDKLKKNNKKKILVIASLILLFLAIISYLLIFKVSSADLKLTLKQENVAASDVVKANVKQEEVDTKNLVLPALLIEQKNLSISQTATATGEGENGNKAKGFITIYNKADREITLPKGTKVTSVASSLNYVLTEDVTITKLEVDDEPGVSNAGIKEDVSIQAEKFGENYNISDSNSNVLFTIEGFGVKDLEGKRFSPFEGGTTEEFTTPSQENVDNLKKEMLPTLEEQAKQRVLNNVPKGYRLIEDSIKFKEEKVTALPEIGKKSEDKTFNLTVEGSVSAIAIHEDDLETIIKAIVSKQNENENQDGVVKNLTDVTEYEIEKVERNEDEVTFTLSTKGVVTNEILEDEVVDSIKGKSYSSAESILNENKDIQKFKLGYSPFFIPRFLRIIPGDESRIDVSIN